MAIAGGIAKVFGDLSSMTWYFQSGTGGGVEGIKGVSGTWSAGQSIGRITWGGDDPSFTASESISPSRLFVGTNASSMLDDHVVCNIAHSAVSLESGDTIIYTSIQIDFTT